MTRKNHSEYQKEYRKHRIHRIIIFTPEEYKILMDTAKRFSKPFSTLVRELALVQASNNYLLPNEKQSRTVQVLLTRIGTNINQLAHVANATSQIPQGIEQISRQFIKLEKDVMNVYHKPIMVEDMVREAIIKNPEYLNRIEAILKEYS